MSRDGKYLATAGDRLIKMWDYHMRLDINFQVSKLVNNADIGWSNNHKSLLLQVAPPFANCVVIFAVGIHVGCKFPDTIVPRALVHVSAQLDF